MRNISLAFTILGSLDCGSYPVTAEILMGLSDSCGVAASLWQIEIWNPPGGYAQLEEDYFFTVDVEEGHKLIANTKCPLLGEGPRPMGCPEDGRGSMIGSDWAPAKEGGVLQVRCKP